MPAAAELLKDHVTWKWNAWTASTLTGTSQHFKSSAEDTAAGFRLAVHLADGDQPDAGLRQACARPAVLRERDPGQSGPGTAGPRPTGLPSGRLSRRPGAFKEGVYLAQGMAGMAPVLPTVGCFFETEDPSGFHDHPALRAGELFNYVASQMATFSLYHGGTGSGPPNKDP